MRPVQYFSKEYLERCAHMTPEQTLKFLEEFRLLHTAKKEGSRLISMKIPEGLLDAFKTKAQLSGIPYQTQIKKLMAEWLSRAGN